MNTTTNTQAPRWSELPVWRRRLNFGIILVLCILVLVFAFAVWNSFQNESAGPVEEASVEAVDQDQNWLNQQPYKIQDDTQIINGKTTQLELTQYISDGSVEKSVLAIMLSMENCSIIDGQQTYTGIDQPPQDYLVRMTDIVFQGINNNWTVFEMEVNGPSVTVFFSSPVPWDDVMLATGMMSGIFLDQNICPVQTDA